MARQPWDPESGSARAAAARAERKLEAEVPAVPVASGPFTAPREAPKPPPTLAETLAKVPGRRLLALSRGALVAGVGAALYGLFRREDGALETLQLGRGAAVTEAELAEHAPTEAQQRELEAAWR